jgi:hypothetical protein
MVIGRERQGHGHGLKTDRVWYLKISIALKKALKIFFLLKLNVILARYLANVACNFK